MESTQKNHGAHPFIAETIDWRVSRDEPDLINVIAKGVIDEAGRKRYPEYYTLIVSGQVTTSKEDSQVAQISGSIWKSDSAKQTLSPLGQLPAALLSEILSYLSREDEVALSLVNKRLASFVRSAKIQQYSELALDCMRAVSIYITAPTSYTIKLPWFLEHYGTLKQVALSDDYVKAHDLYIEALSTTSSVAGLHSEALRVSRALSERLTRLATADTKCIPDAWTWERLLGNHATVSELYRITMRANGLYLLTCKEYPTTIITHLALANDLELVKSAAYQLVKDKRIKNLKQVFSKIKADFGQSGILSDIQLTTRLVSAFSPQKVSSDLLWTMENVKKTLYNDVKKFWRDSYLPWPHREIYGFYDSDLEDPNALKNWFSTAVDILLPWVMQSPISHKKRNEKIYTLLRSLPRRKEIDKLWHIMTHTLGRYSDKDRIEIIEKLHPHLEYNRYNDVYQWLIDRFLAKKKWKEQFISILTTHTL